MRELFINVEDYEKKAKALLPTLAFDYYAAGADEGITLRDNKDAFQRIKLRPRVLVDVSKVNTSTTVLGEKIAFPVIVAPTAFQRMANDLGEVATCEAASECDTIMCLSSMSNTKLEDVSRASTNKKLWFQLYVFRNREITRRLVNRAEKSGYKVLCVTVDAPKLGRRIPDMRNSFRLPTHLAAANLSMEGCSNSSTSLNNKFEFADQLQLEHSPTCSFHGAIISNPEQSPCSCSQRNTVSHININNNINILRHSHSQAAPHLSVTTNINIDSGDNINLNNNKLLSIPLSSVYSPLPVCPKNTHAYDSNENNLYYTNINPNNNKFLSIPQPYINMVLNTGCNSCPRLQNNTVQKISEKPQESRKLVAGEEAHSELSTFFDNQIDDALTWEDISWLKSITSMKIVVKGILTHEDALLAVQHGVDGIVVSNHGARQVDTSVSTIEALPEVVRAVRSTNKSVDVIIDSGVRKGTDILKALALGASAVMVGRPIVYGLACEGKVGVKNVLAILQQELILAMKLCGCPDVHNLPPSLILPRKGKRGQRTPKLFNNNNNNLQRTGCSNKGKSDSAGTSATGDVHAVHRGSVTAEGNSSSTKIRRINVVYKSKL